MYHTGSLKNAHFTLPCSLPIKSSDGNVDILGIQIQKERNDLTPIHFYRKLPKIDKFLLPWKGKYMSICGEITLINSLVNHRVPICLPICLWFCLHPVTLLLKLYEQKIFSFIWNGKPDKIKRAYLYNEYEFGGQK